MNSLQQKEIFFMELPPKTKAIYRQDGEFLYIGINNTIQNQQDIDSIVSMI
jgi:hypothetical protein